MIFVLRLFIYVSLTIQHLCLLGIFHSNANSDTQNLDHCSVSSCEFTKGLLLLQNVRLRFIKECSKATGFIALLSLASVHSSALAHVQDELILVCMSVHT